MSDKTVKKAKKTFPTHRMTWVAYIASHLERARIVEAKGDTNRAQGIREALELYVRRNGPSGSGIDTGTRILDSSTPGDIRLYCEFHHMDSHGSYGGWTQHMISVQPSFLGSMSLRVGGLNRNDIKDYLHDTYHSWLCSEADHPALVEYILD